MKTASVTVRTAQWADRFDLHHNCSLDQPLREAKDHLCWCLREQEKGRLTCLVAEINGQAVAIGQLTVLRDSGEIGSLIVAPERRRQGIGTALILALIEEARQRQVRTLEITANVDIPWIRAWYERLGFTFQREHDFPNERVAILTMDLARGDPTSPPLCISV